MGEASSRVTRRRGVRPDARAPVRHHGGGVNEEGLPRLARVRRLLDRELGEELCLVNSGHRLGAVIRRCHAVVGKVHVVDRRVVEVVLKRCV